MRRTAIYILKIALACALLALAGCEGKPSPDNIARLQPGVTTYDQALALLGKPYHQDSRGGKLLAMWASVRPDATRSAVLIVFSNKGVAEEIRSQPAP